MSAKKITVSGIVTISGFVLVPVFYFLDAPPSWRELLLMLIAATYGAAFIGAVSLFALAWRKNKAEASMPKFDRLSTISELEGALHQLELSSAEEEGKKVASTARALEARRNGWDDFAAEHSAESAKSDVSLNFNRSEISRIRAELIRLESMSDENWKKEQKTRRRPALDQR